MADRKRDKEKNRDRESRDHRDHRDRDRDRDRDQDRLTDRERERNRDRRKRSRSPEHHRRRSPSPEHRRSRSRSSDRHHRRHGHKPRSSSQRIRDGSDDDREFRRSKGSDANSGNGVAKKVESPIGGVDATMEVAEVDSEEIELMKVMGIPVGFDSTKGKHVDGADVSAVRSVTKRQPRQYMNRRGGFNRPLPPERNR